MSLFSLAGVFIAVTCVISMIAVALERQSWVNLSGWVDLDLRICMHYSLLAMIPLCVLVHQGLGDSFEMFPVAKVFDTENGLEISATPSSLRQVSSSVSVAFSQTAVEWIKHLASLLIVGWMAQVLWRLGRRRGEWRELTRWIAHCRSVRMIGNARVLKGPGCFSPFSLQTPRNGFIIIPENVDVNQTELRMIVRHEVSHLKNRDHWWNLGYQLLLDLLDWWPCMRRWYERVCELQEMRADAAVCRRYLAQRRAYALVLTNIAGQSLASHPGQAWGLAMVATKDGKSLQRRIESMFRSDMQIAKWRKPAMLGTVLAGSLLVTLGAMGAIDHRKVDYHEVRKVVQKNSSGGFEFVVNERVLTQLNRFVHNPGGRRFFQQSVERMQAYRPLLEEKLRENALPLDLLAVPLVESGYQNLRQGSNLMHGAGIWMFIKNTARSFGLKVDDQVDERLDVPKLTDAAVLYFKRSYGRFGRWDLALMGYNMGDFGVLRAIDRHGTKDAWELVDKGVENDRDYLAKVMAAALILRDPGLLE
jgi:membrane-bound lytic murein transglycosylase D